MARASIMLATLVQAINSTSPNAATMGEKNSRTWAVGGSAVACDRRYAPIALSASARSAVICRAQVVRAAVACRALNSRFSLPTTSIRRGCSGPNRFGPSSIRPDMLIGAQKSLGVSPRPENPSFAMPITRSGEP